MSYLTDDEILFGFVFEDFDDKIIYPVLIPSNMNIIAYIDLILECDGFLLEYAKAHDPHFGWVDVCFDKAAYVNTYVKGPIIIKFRPDSSLSE